MNLQILSPVASPQSSRSCCF